MISSQLSRRGLLTGNFCGPEDSVMRPPPAVADFLMLCEGCRECETVCPENIIIIGKDNRPALDFSRGACTFCGACAEACPTGALSSETDPVWAWIADVTDACLSLNGVTCRACEDACDPYAIRFRLAVGGKSMPIIDSQTCTGCGACAYACPTGAVAFKQQRPNLSEDLT